MIELSLTHIGGAIVVLGGGIVGLIKGGYLRIGKNSENPKHEVVVSEYCPRHESLEADREKRWDKLDQTVAGWDKMAQTLLQDAIERKGEVKVHEKRIDKLDDVVVGINTSLISIAKDVAVDKALVNQKESFIHDAIKTIFEKLDKI